MVRIVIVYFWGLPMVSAGQFELHVQFKAFHSYCGGRSDTQWNLMLCCHIFRNETVAVFMARIVC